MSKKRIIWAPGELRPFESVVGFIGRFSKLNGITAAECLAYFSRGMNRSALDAPVSSTMVKSIAEELDERQDVISSVFAPTLDVDFHELTVRRNGLPYGTADQLARYCPSCMKEGFHSYLHDAAWLCQCPFHSSPLVAYPAHLANRVANRVSAYMALAEKTCSSWPWRPDDDSGTREISIAPLQEWLTLARAAAREVSRGMEWTPSGSPYCSASEIIGQLRSITPMPANVAPLFTDIGEACKLHTKGFELDREDVRREAANVIGWDVLLRFFHLASAYGVCRAGYLDVLRQAQNLLASWHLPDEASGSCRCRWSCWSYFGDYYWNRRSDDVKFVFQGRCPVEHAIADLERSWGDPRKFISKHASESQLYDFIASTKEMQQLGLVRCTTKADLDVDPVMPRQAQQLLEWVAPPKLTELLNELTVMLIQDRALELNRWIYEIKTRDLDPSSLGTATQSVRMCVTEEFLRLQHWRRIDMLESLRYVVAQSRRKGTDAGPDGYGKSILTRTLTENRCKAIARCAKSLYSGH